MHRRLALSILAASLASTWLLAAASDDWNRLMELGRSASAAGDAATAEHQIRAALDRIDVENPDDPRLSVTVTALALTLVRQERCEAAAALFAGHAEIDSEATPDEQRLVASCLNAHARALVLRQDPPFDAQRNRRAEALLRKILPAFERLYGNQSLEVADVLDRLSAVLWDTGSAFERVALRERHLAIYERVLGLESGHVVIALLKLGGEVARVDPDRAEKIYLQAFERARQNLGDDARLLSQICRVLEEFYLDRSPQASRAWGGARREYEQRLPESLRPDPIVQAADLRRQGDAKAASSLIRQVIEQARDQEGANLVRALLTGAHISDAAGDEARAEAYRDEAYRHASAHADTDPDSLHRVLLAFAYREAAHGRTEAAIDYAWKASAFGPSHPGMFGQLYNAAGQHARALDLFAEELAIEEEFYGPESLLTTYTLTRLADTCIALGYRKQAEDYLVRAISIFAAVSPADPLHRSSRMRLEWLRSN